MVQLHSGAPVFQTEYSPRERSTRNHPNLKRVISHSGRTARQHVLLDAQLFDVPPFVRLTWIGVFVQSGPTQTRYE